MPGTFFLMSFNLVRLLSSLSWREGAIGILDYVIAAEHGGRQAKGRETYVDSMIVTPWVEVLSRPPHGTGHIMAECDRTRLQDMRKNLPSIRYRRLQA